MNRRSALRLIGGSAAAVVACAPAASAPVATSAPAAASAPPAAAPGAAAPGAAPQPARTPFDIAKMPNPLIDTHAHPIPPAQGDQAKYYDGIVGLMDQHGVAMTVLHRNAEWTTGTNRWGKDHDEWVRAAMDRHPGRLLGFLAGFDPASPDAPDYVRSQLQAERARWKAVGELDLRNPGPRTQIAINSPTVLQIAKIAGDFGVPFVFHYNFDYGTSSIQAGMAEVADALTKNPGTTYVLAHSPAPPLMQQFPNLWGEVSLFAPQTLAVLRQMAANLPATLDRVVLCLTDLQSPDLRVSVAQPPLSYADAVAAARAALASFTAEQRDKIAHKNVMRLLKLG